MASPAPFIVGVARSGTTLLRLMLDAHSDLAIPPETAFIPELLRRFASGPPTAAELAVALTTFETWPDFHLTPETLASELQAVRPFQFSEGLRVFYRTYARRFGKPRWGDKSPEYGHHMPDIAALLPEARFVHIIRDGRDVAASLRPLWFAPSRDIAELAQYWAGRVRRFRENGRGLPYLEIRYEHLITDTEATLRRVCAFLNLPFDERMLRYHLFAPMRLDEHEGRLRADGTVRLTKDARLAQQAATLRPPDRTRCGAFRRSLALGEQEAFAAAAGDLLCELGYA